MKETLLQQACVRWFRHLPGVDYRFLIAVPNEGKRTRATASRMKAEGLNAGVSDLILFHPKAEKKPLFLECKLPTTKQTKSQESFEMEMVKAGYEYHIFRSFDEFEAIVSEYLELKYKRKSA